MTRAYPINLNNDAHTDLVLLRLGSSACCSVKATVALRCNKRLGFDGGRAWTGFRGNVGAGEAFPTLAFGNYVDRRAPGYPLAPAKTTS